MMRRMLPIAVLLLVALPLAAEPVPGARSWRVTLAMHGGDDSAAVAKRLAAMYRGELVTPVDENGSFLIALTDAAAALLGEDPGVHSVQADPAVAVPSPPVAVAPMRTPPAVAHGSTSWSLGTYSYDGSGNIRKLGNDVYVYDGNSRLVSGTAAGKSEKYTYDEFGNILAIETSGSPRRLLGVDPASNRMDRTTGVFAGQSVTYDMTAGYDGNGNVTSYMLDRFEYDGVNVVRKAYVAGKWRSYVYNASDERIAVIERSAESGGETRSDWTFRDASGQVLRRLSREAGQWQWNQDYIYRDGQMLASEVGAPVKRYQYHLDHLGTPRLITGNGGVEISRHTYLPFGVEVGATPGQNPADGEWKKFTGHERDQGSIDYMHARYYSPAMGRFLSPDPVISEWTLYLPQGWNRYSYVMNNPMRFTDPTGREIECVPGEKEGDPPICGEKIDVEGEEPKVEPQPLPPMVFAGMLPLETQQLRMRERDERERAQIAREQQRISNCFDDHRFSSVIGDLTGSATARSVTGFLEIGSEISLAGDVVATAYKATHTSLGNQPYASGMNAAFRAFGRAVGNPALGRSLTKFGDKATPAAAVFGAFTAAYNATTYIQCRAGLL